MALRKICVFFSLGFLLFFAGSCKRSGNNGTDFYTIYNNSDKPVNINVYRNITDYNSAANIYYKNVIPVHSSLAMPYSQFQEGQTYYIDWYSNDFLYTNWYWTNVTVLNGFALDKNYSQFYINAGEIADPSRSIWMNGLNALTHWKAVDAFTFSAGTYTSVWTSLSPAQQNLQLTLNKDFTANLTGLSQSNLSIDTAMRFRVNYDTALHTSTVTIFNPDFITYGTLTGNFNAVTQTFNGNKSVMLAYFPALGYYEMVRQ